MTATGAQQDATGRPARTWLWWGRRRSVVLDVGLGLVSAFECALEGVGFADKAALPVPFGVLFGLMVGAVLVLRRRWPIAVVLVSIAMTPAEMGICWASSGCTRSPRPTCRAGSPATLAGMSLAAT